MKDNIVESKVEFNKNDFIELFLYDLIIRGINKINIFELKYDLAEFYNNEYYKELFMDMSLEEDNEQNFVELEKCIIDAQQKGFLGNPFEDSTERLIFLEDLNGVYDEELQDKMSSLVDEYLLKLRKNIGLVKKMCK